ncbi:hypothetical protein PS2_030500 [Malus domestica]
MTIGEARDRLSRIVLDRASARYLRVFDVTTGEFVLLFELRRSELSGMIALENTLQARIGVSAINKVEFIVVNIYETEPPTSPPPSPSGTLSPPTGVTRSPPPPHGRTSSPPPPGGTPLPPPSPLEEEMGILPLEVEPGIPLAIKI